VGDGLHWQPTSEGIRAMTRGALGDRRWRSR
jgi:hypothetical protein